MQAAITAMGTANPQYKRAQLETADLICAGINLSPVEKRILKSVYKSTGIDYRHSVLKDYCSEAGQFEFFPNDPSAPFPSTAARMKVYKAEALNLALAAIENCFASAFQLKKEELSHLITVSCTGLYAPGLDIEITQTLNLNSSIKRTAINFMGCYGAFNALKVAEAICKSDAKAKVLIVCVELCTIHFQNKVDLMNIVSNALFADGAAAVLVEACTEQVKSLVLESFHCDLLPQSSQEMAWQVADQGFDIVLSSYVPEIIESGIAKFMQKLLRQTASPLQKIDFYAIHPGGLKILEACEKALNLSPEDNKFSYEVLRQNGNMSSPTVLFVLNKIWQSIVKTDHQKSIFSCAFGPGLTLESLLLRVCS